MKITFFADTEHGMVAGFCPYRADGHYGYGFNPDDDENPVVIDVVECATFNDAKRHMNELAGRDPEQGIYAWGDEEL